MPSITTFTEYQQQYRPLDAQRYAELVAHQAECDQCERAADDERSAGSISDAEHGQRVDSCRSARDAKDKATGAHFDPLLADVEARAREGLGKLPRLIISWDDLSDRAVALTDVFWHKLLTGGQPYKAPILSVKSFAELRQVLAHDRWMNELLLMVRARDRTLVLAGEQETFTKLVDELGGAVKTHVDDRVYVHGPLSGNAPDDLEPFRAMLGAGVISTAWDGLDEVVSDKLCFPPSAVLPFQPASGFGSLAERYIALDYCRKFGCSQAPFGPNAVHPIGPAWTDYFDRNNPTEWKDFLVTHDPSLSDPDDSLLIEALAVVGVRPDMATNKGVRREYYEVKPYSPSGAYDGMVKVLALTGLMAELKQPYIPGVSYSGGRIPMGTFLVEGYPVSASLRVHRPHPGVLLYLLCLEGELVKLLKIMTLAALVLLIIAMILGSLAPIPIPAPI